MPLKSQAQAAFLKHNDPAVYDEFAAETPKGTQLPYKVSKPAAPKSNPGMKRQKVMAATLRQGTLN